MPPKTSNDAAIDRGLRVVGTWLNDNGDTANPLGAVLADLRAYAAHAGLDFTTGDDLVSPADDQLAFGERYLETARAYDVACVAMTRAMRTLADAHDGLRGDLDGTTTNTELHAAKAAELNARAAYNEAMWAWTMVHQELGHRADHAVIHERLFELRLAIYQEARP